MPRGIDGGNRTRDVGGNRELGRALGNLAGALFDAFGGSGTVRDPRTRDVLTDAADALSRTLGGDGLAMTPREFEGLRRAVDNEAFDDNKTDVIATAARHSYFTPGQVRDLLDEFSFDDNKLDALEHMAPKLTDRGASYEIYEAFTFSSAKDKARDILSGY